MHVVIVGGSVAGTRALQALRTAGVRTTLITADAEFPPCDPPALSKQVLAGEDVEAFRLDGMLPDDLTVHAGTTATSIDIERQEVRTDTGRTIPYDRLILAPGSVPRAFPEHPAGSQEGLYHLRTLDDARALRAALVPGSHLVVVGAGLIGCEVASVAVEHGVRVTVLEPGTTPLERLAGHRMGTFVRGIHEAAGVTFRFGARVARIHDDRRVRGVILEDGSAVAGDAVLVAIGGAPNTGWLAGSGLTIGNGVLCDTTCTALGAPNVMVAGDAAAIAHPTGAVRHEHWTAAAEQGSHVGRAVLLDSADRPTVDSTEYVWSDQYDLKIQALGRPSAGTEAVLVDDPEHQKYLGVFVGAQDLIVGMVAINLPRALPRVRRAIARGTPFHEMDWSFVAGGAGVPVAAARPRS